MFLGDPKRRQHVEVGFDFLDSAYRTELGNDFLCIFLDLARFAWRSTKGDLGEFYRRGVVVSSIGQEDLATRNGRSRRHINKMLQDIEREGWIKKVRTERRLVYVLGYRPRKSGRRLGEAWLFEDVLRQKLAGPKATIADKKTEKAARKAEKIMGSCDLRSHDMVSQITPDVISDHIEYRRGIEKHIETPSGETSPSSQPSVKRKSERKVNEVGAKKTAEWKAPDFIKFYSKVFKKRFRREPAISWAKDGRLIKQLQGLAKSPVELRNVILWYVNSWDQLRTSWKLDGAPSIGFLRAAWSNLVETKKNGFRGKKSTPAADAASGWEGKGKGWQEWDE